MMTLTVEGYPIGRSVEAAGDGTDLFAVWPLELPGCIAQGESMTDAVARLRDILPNYRAALEARGAAAPPPRALPPVTIGFATFATNAGAIYEPDLLRSGVPA